MYQSPKSCFVFGEFRLDGAERRLLRNETPISLPPKILDTLLLLVENAGHLVEKDEFMKRLWPGTFVGEDALARNISILRKTLGESGDSQSFIATIPTRGYRFVAAVREVPCGDRELAGPITPATDSAPVPTNVSQNSVSPATARHATGAAPEVEAPRGRGMLLLQSLRSRIIFGIVTLTLGVLVGLLTYLLLSPTPMSRLLRRADAGRIRSLAVLPLENLSGDPSQEYFADGMTEALITDLGKIGELRVISRTSVMQYKGKQKRLGDIGRELHVDAVIEGSVMHAEGRVRVTANLIEALTDRHLWAGIYDRDLHDVLSVQSDFAEAIAHEVQAKLTPQERAVLKSTRIIKPAAYEANLKGRYFWDKRSTEGITKAIEFFKEAIRVDPEFALPYSGLAEVYAGMPDYMAIPPRESYDKARVAANKALELDGTLAEAHTALGGISLTDDYDWSASEREFRRAIELNPGYADAYHWHAINLMFMSRWGEAIAEIERARQLDPMSIIISANVGFVYYNARRFDEAIAAEHKALELDGNYAVAYQYLGLAYLGKRMYTEAIANLRRAVDLSGGVAEDAAELAFAYAVAGNRAEAQKILHSLKGRSRHEYVPSFSLAVAYAGLGDKNQALAYLQRAYQERCDKVPTMKVNPLLESLHSDPRFQNLLKRIGFPS